MELILLMRHASHENGYLSDSGVAQVAEVAHSLAEWATISCQRISAVKYIGQEVRCEGGSDGATLTGECQATAERLVLELRASLRRVRAEDALSCASASEFENVSMPATYSPSNRTRQLVTTADAVRGLARPETIAVVVSNEPQIGWLLDELTGTRMSFGPGEIIALDERDVMRPLLDRQFPFVRGASHRVRWALTPKSDDDERVTDALIDKIGSKMRTAGVFGGLILGLLTFVITNMVKGDVPTTDRTVLALAALGASAWLFFATLFFCDSLTMPVRFWAHGRADLLASTRRPGWLLERPPSSSRRVLHQNMVRTWKLVFLPAVVAFAVGAGAMVWALDGTGPDDRGTAIDLTRTHVVWLIVTGIAVATWSWWFRPRVGSDD